MYENWKLEDLRAELAFRYRQAVRHYNELDLVQASVEQVEADIDDLQQRIAQLEAQDGD